MNDLTITSRSPNTLLHHGNEAGEPVHWYALHTRSRHEKKVRDRLLERNVETFLPLCERWNRWKDRTKRVELALFPGYCFARCSVSDHVRILDVPGVADVVGINGRAEPVASREIEDVRRLIASRFRYDPHPLLDEGMEVEVVRGPLAGVRGRLLRKDRTTRLVLGVTLIHQAAVVEIHPADVARV